MKKNPLFFVGIFLCFFFSTTLVEQAFPQQMKKQYQLQDSINSYVAKFEMQKKARIELSATQARDFLRNAKIRVPVKPPSGITISTINIQQGTHLSMFAIIGAGFTPDTKVHLKVGDDRVLMAFNVNIEDSTRLSAQIPDLSGLAMPYDGYIQLSKQLYVSNQVYAKSVWSNKMPFRFIPEIVLSQLAFTKNQVLADSDIAWYTPPGRGEVYVTSGAQACGSTTPGHRLSVTHRPITGGNNPDGRLEGTDKVFLRTRLRVPWVVDRMWFNPTAPGPQVTTLEHSSEGAQTPFFIVSWWVEPGGYASYSASFLVKGPKGVPHF